jgi:hypothetical protein
MMVWGCNLDGGFYSMSGLGLAVSDLCDFLFFSYFLM